VYVVGKDVGAGVVHVAKGRENSALYSSRVLLLAPNWIGDAPLIEAAAERFGDAGAMSRSSSSGGIQCSYRARYRQPPAACSIRPLLPGEQFAVSKYCGSSQAGTAAVAASTMMPHQEIQKVAHAASAAIDGGTLRPAVAVAAATVQQQQGTDQQGMWIAELEVALRGITPGQMFVMYDGEVCLGSAVIAAHGPTLAEQQ
jgi:tRNA U34 2-thiouridine synthase MnmA/TrmU